MSEEELRAQLDAMRRRLALAESENQELADDLIKLKAELGQERDESKRLVNRLVHLDSLIHDAANFAAYRLQVNPDDPNLGRVVYVSPSFTELTGVANPYDQAEWFKGMHPDEKHTVVPAQAEALRTLELNQTVRFFHPERQEWVWLNFHAVGVTDERGLPRYFNGIVRDVTREKRAELELERYREELEERVERRTFELAQANQSLSGALAEKEILLKEIHHRVKNNLQSIASLLDLQSMHTGSEVLLSAFQECRDRVRAMCMVHNQLYQREDMGLVDLDSYAENLCWSLAAAYGAGKGGLELELVPHGVTMDLDRAIACGLALNELVSNSLKYARTNGRVRIRLEVLEADGHISLSFRDDGPGLPEGLDPHSADTLGLKLVHGLLVDQLGGRLVMEPGPGTRFKALIPQKRARIPEPDLC